jgi:hypothetical protein
MTSLQETPVSQETDGLVGWIIEVQGEVRLKRKEWLDYRKASKGTKLYPGDMLHPAPQAKVIVQCANGKTIWSVPAGMISGATNGCPPQAVPLSRTRGDIAPLRNAISPLIPYIISPRRTKVLNSLPMLRWNAAPGASRYTVSLIADEEVLWETQVEGTEVVYSGESPLESGVDYLLEIETDTGASSQDEKSPDLGFCLLDENEATVVREAVEQLVKLDLADETKSFALANLYRVHDLKAEAIATLEALVKRGSQTAAIYRTLGDLYLEVGLNSLAENHDMKASQLAAEAGDVEE